MESKKQELFSLVGFLRSAMESQQLIPARLSELSGVPSSVLSRIFSEKGEGPRQLSAINLYKIMKALKVIGDAPVYPYEDKELHDKMEIIFHHRDPREREAFEQRINASINKIREGEIMRREVNEMKKDIDELKSMMKEVITRLPRSATRKTGSDE